MATTTRISVEPFAGALGAEVRGLDLTHELRPDELGALRTALLDHLVIALPDQPMSLDDLERLTDQLGGRDTTPYVTPLADRPHVIRVIKEPDDEINFANGWHSDLSYLSEPPSFTLLHASVVPDHGGDTMWANQYLAAETLSDGLRSTLRTLRAIHSAGMAYGTGGYLDSMKAKTSMAIEPSPDAHRTETHPILVRHPETGREALYVNPVYTTRIEGWSHAESQALLQHLYRHAVHENATCRLRWRPGTLAIWDNRCTQHMALDDYRGVRREMFRTSVVGGRPRAASESPETSTGTDGAEDVVHG